MNNENTYNYREIQEALKKVKGFNITVDKKKYHKDCKIWEVKSLYEDLMSINVWLFETNNEYNFYNYKQAIELNETKKDLDKKLRLCILYIGRQLEQISRLAS